MSVVNFKDYVEGRVTSSKAEEEDLFGEDACPACGRLVRPSMVEKGHEYVFECAGVGDMEHPLHPKKTWTQVVPTRMF